MTPTLKALASQTAAAAAAYERTFLEIKKTLVQQMTKRNDLMGRIYPIFLNTDTSDLTPAGTELYAGFQDEILDSLNDDIKDALTSHHEAPMFTAALADAYHVELNLDFGQSTLLTEATEPTLAAAQAVDDANDELGYLVNTPLSLMYQDARPILDRALHADDSDALYGVNLFALLEADHYNTPQTLAKPINMIVDTQLEPFTEKLSTAYKLANEQLNGDIADLNRYAKEQQAELDRLNRQITYVAPIMARYQAEMADTWAEYETDTDDFD